MVQHPNGAWIWVLSKQNSDYLDQLKQVNCQRVYLKVFDGRSRSMFWKDQCTPEIINQFNTQGIEVYGWGYHYGTSEDIKEQIDAVRQAMDCGLNGYVLDLEKEVEDVRTHYDVKVLLQALRPYIEEETLGYTSFGDPRYHPNVPWGLLDDLCDFAMPQMYFEKWTSNPDNYEDRVNGAFKAHEELGLKKPIFPIWGSESDTKNPATATVLQDYLNRYPGSSIWRLPNAGERGEAWNLNYGGQPKVVPVEPFPEQKAAKALFKMDLKYSSGLLYGNIFLFDGEGKQIFDAVATTGRPSYQTSSHIWQRAKGPIPDVEGLTIGTEDAIIETNDIQDWSFPIRPNILENPNPTGLDRGGFRIYNDAGNPGTSGGIGIINANTFNRFRALLLALKQQGIEQIPLEIQYTKPKESLPASAIFKLSRAQTWNLIQGSLSVLDNNGETIFEAIATSGQPGYQSADYHWRRAKGCIPSEDMISNGPIRISTHGYYTSTIGIEGMFFHILPDPFYGKNGGIRSEFGVHLDANFSYSPGSAGCIVLRYENDFDIFIDLMAKAKQAGRKEIPLAIVYSDSGSRGYADEWWEKLFEERRLVI
ncbi:MAG: hypothetical protein F6K08_21940 [Okeania sp. SIO1H6]|nr:hypothetical protein [Okeania sp. SIO1H6]